MTHDNAETLNGFQIITLPHPDDSKKDYRRGKKDYVKYNTIAL
jgi:hypothetical protein